MAVEWATALKRVAELQAKDGGDVLDACRTQFLGHDAPAERAVLLLHGFTNSPPQFREIAAAYHAQGANVLVPRIPFHGLADPLNHELTGLTPEVLADFTEEVVAVAAGLGERLTVEGLSLGGLLAAWAAKNCDAVTDAVLIAPFMQPKAVPKWIDVPFDAVMSRAKDRFNWWNPKSHEAEVAGTYAYPQFSLKAIASMIDMRRRLEREPVLRTTRLESVLLVLNANDIAIRNDVAREVTDKLFTSLTDRLDVAMLEKSLRLTHDVVEPNGSNRDRMDVARENLWPLLGLAVPPAGTLGGPPPGGGYYADLVASDQK
jgi:carboxylesterase